MTFNQKFYMILTALLIAFWSALIGILWWGVESYLGGE